MIILRRWLLILFALMLSAEPLWASASREERAYSAAVATFNAEIWGRAETEFAQFRQRFSNSSRLAEAVLLQAEAEYKQGKFESTIALLTAAGNLTKAGGLADQYAYWTAQAQFHNGKFAPAAETFAALAAGADALKIFPGELASMAYVKAITAVLPKDARLLLVGGVSAATIGQWKNSPIAGFGIGSSIFKPGMRPDEVQNRASELISAWQQA